MSDSRSIGLSFHLLCGSSSLALKRFNCSSSETENQYLIRIVPDLISILSNIGQDLMNSSYSPSSQNPITLSTPALLYQLLSNITISPAAGRWLTYLWKYHSVFCLSVGAGRAATLTTLGLRYCAILFITPPFPAASLPSKTITTLSPLAFTHSWSLISSSCSLNSSLLYLFFPILSIFSLPLPPIIINPP